MTSRQVSMSVRMRSLVAKIGERVGEHTGVWLDARELADELDRYFELRCQERED